MPTYLIDGRRIETDDAGFVAALASAHANARACARPLCLCKPPGLEMYVARFGDDYVIKRMPCTGSDHAPDCASFEPPVERQDLASGAAISEDPETGLTTIRLGFALCRLDGEARRRSPATLADSVASDRARLGLGGLVWYLWNEAGLTRWIPEFEGKRHWATVRRLLMSAASRSVARGEPLRNQLFVPELFVPEQRETLAARRSRVFSSALRRGAEQRLLLLCGEVKEIAPSRHGYMALVKHIPDQLFALDERLYRKMEQRFERELSLWGSDAALRIITLATFGVSDAGVPQLEGLTLMTVNAQWIPVGNGFETALVDRLVREQRRFIKSLPLRRDDLPSCTGAILTDVGPRSAPLRLAFDASPDQSDASRITAGEEWVWNVDAGPMPPLPRVYERPELRREPSDDLPEQPGQATNHQHVNAR